MRFTELTGSINTQGAWVSLPVSSDKLAKRLSEFSRSTGRSVVAVRLRADAAAMPREILRAKYGESIFERIEAGSVRIRVGSRLDPYGGGFRSESDWLDFDHTPKSLAIAEAFRLVTRNAELLEVVEEAETEPEAAPADLRRKK
jgi:hypothetical protein